mmetsp:Transcript_8171/g.23451  ORF Transcript_8171/g.23451 Transcript_8171/m.23451 type:complete len:220 (-) Transcript_8171:640-1299(-)
MDFDVANGHDFLPEALQLLVEQISRPVFGGVERHRDAHLAGCHDVNADLVLCKRVEDLREEPKLADHGVGADVNDGDVLLEDEAGQQRVLHVPVHLNDSPRSVGVVRVLHAHRHAGAEISRGHGLGVEDRGPEVSQLGCLVVCEGWDGHGRGDQTRVGGQHSIHILPHLNFGVPESRADDSGGEVAAPPPKCCDCLRFPPTSQEPGDNGHIRLLAFSQR